LVQDVTERITIDAIAAGLAAEKCPSSDGDGSALGYAGSVATYLAFAEDKLVNWLTTLSHWWPAQDKIRPTFTRQAIPMTWDYSEANPFAAAAGDFGVAVHGLADALLNLPAERAGHSTQADVFHRHP
jgi:putative DNA methylase